MTSCRWTSLFSRCWSFKGDGLIYRKWTTQGYGEEVGVEQLAIPKVCRKAVLELVDEIPLAGYMGKDKASQRILKRFYWLTLHKDDTDFCRSCE